MGFKAVLVSFLAVLAVGVPDIALGAEVQATVYGLVLADTGEPLAYTNIFFTDGFEGTMSTPDGRFTLIVTSFGERTLTVSYVGRETKQEVMTINQGDSVYVEFILGERPIELEEVVSTASTYTLVDKEDVSLTSLDVVRTPGAAADVFRALQTFPGLVQVDEGAGLFVRGGDVSETLTLLDRATVSYPYRYSSPTGGFFGTFDPFLLDGIRFSTGAFPARYGNALSGIVDLESKGLPNLRSVNMTASLAAISIMGAVPLSHGWGIRFAGNRSHTGLLFRVNGGDENFEEVPRSIDGSISLNWRTGHFGWIKLFGFASEDNIAAAVRTPAYEGVYEGTGWTELGNLSFSQILGDKLLLKGSLSGTRHTQASKLGVLDLEIDDLSEKACLDASLNMMESLTLNLGTELENRLSDVEGRVPDDENDFSHGADFLQFSTRYRSLRIGNYMELDTRVARRLFVNIGLRTDRESNSRDWSIDPRISAVYQLTANGGIKLAWGIYHQFPAPEYHDPLSGNPDIGSMNATHYVVGYDYELELFRMRIEAYYKRYRELLLEHDSLNYTNDGYGEARGLDFFFKGNVGFVEGRIAYSYLRAERKEFEKIRLVPADFDITHTANLVVMLPLAQGFEVSTSFRYATGKPFTPAPGMYNSERLPSYQKWDVSLTRLYSFSQRDLAVFFISVSNVLDTGNIQDYFYSPDYSERTEVKSYFGRSVYFGVSMTLR